MANTALMRLVVHGLISTVYSHEMPFVKPELELKLCANVRIQFIWLTEYNTSRSHYSSFFFFFQDLQNTFIGKKEPAEMKF